MLRVRHPHLTGRSQRAEGTGGDGDPRGLPVEEGEERPGVRPKAGGRERARSWLEEGEGRGSRDGKGRRRSVGQRRRRQRAGQLWSRRPSGQRGWLEEEGAGQVGYSTLEWWRAGCRWREDRQLIPTVF